jgi:hypothetical protein
MTEDSFLYVIFIESAPEKVWGGSYKRRLHPPLLGRPTHRERLDEGSAGPPLHRGDRGGRARRRSSGIRPAPPPVLYMAL